MTNSNLLKKLENLKNNLTNITSPEEIYKLLTGREPKLYSPPISTVYGSDFFTLDALLKESIKNQKLLKNKVKEEIIRLVTVYKKYESLKQHSLLKKLSEDDRRRVLKLYGEEFVREIGDAYLTEYHENEWMGVINKKGDLYHIYLNEKNKKYVSPEIIGLRLKPCSTPPPFFYHSVYSSEYGVFVFEIGACKRIAIPKEVLPFIEIGKEPREDIEYEEPCGDIEYEDPCGDIELEHRDRPENFNFKVVPSEKHCPHFLEYNPTQKKLTWKRGGKLFTQKFSFSF